METTLLGSTVPEPAGDQRRSNRRKRRLVSNSSNSKERRKGMPKVKVAASRSQRGGGDMSPEDSPATAPCDGEVDRFTFVDTLLYTSRTMRDRTSSYLREAEQITGKYQPPDPEATKLWNAWRIAPSVEVAKRRSVAGWGALYDGRLPEESDGAEEEEVQVPEQLGGDGELRTEKLNANQLLLEQRRQRRKNRELPHTGRTIGRRQRRRTNLRRYMGIGPPGRPPPSGYTVFVSQMSRQLKRLNEDLRGSGDTFWSHQPHMVRHLSTLWNEQLGEQVKNKYKKFAGEAKKDYKRMMREYEATGSYVRSNIYGKVDGIWMGLEGTKLRDELVGIAGDLAFSEFERTSVMQETALQDAAAGAVANAVGDDEIHI